MPRRVVPNVLTVAALQIRHPVPFIVLVEAEDAARHGASVIHGGGASNFNITPTSNFHGALGVRNW